jgi:dethiobiotin synthetase
VLIREKIMADSKQLFITATDTGVGKTLISGLLLGYLLKKVIRAGYQKWVATGVENSVEDLDRVRQLAGWTEPPSASLDLTVPYRLPFAASPHLAAEMVGKTIEPENIIQAYEQLRETYEILLVEGVGGLLVPLRRDLRLVDLLARLQIPTLLVARTGLSTLNHTLLSLEALRRREIPVLGVLLSDGPVEDETIAADNHETIAELGRVAVIGRLPYYHDDQSLHEAFAPLGSRIVDSL